LSNKLTNVSQSVSLFVKYNMNLVLEKTIEENDDKHHEDIKFVNYENYSNGP